MLNLRGRIVTAIDMRNRLEVKKREDSAAPMAIGIEAKGELFGLLVDAVGEVLKPGNTQREPNPVNLDHKLAGLSAGVYRLEGQLLVVLDVDRVRISAARPWPHERLKRGAEIEAGSPAKLKVRTQ